MKNLLSILILLGFISVSPLIADDVWVDSYTRSDGTVVDGHYRSSPNSTVTDNFSYYGNINPYTGKIGTNKYKNFPTSQYYAGGYKSSNSFYSSSYNLKYNSPVQININRNTIINQIEKELTKRGYWLIDEDYELDWNSKRAIKKEQVKNNIPNTGKLDMRTLEVLGVSID